MRLAPIALLVAATAGCGTTHDLSWRITFSGGVPSGTVVVHAEIREGSCTGAARVAYDVDVATHGATATLPPMNLSAGTYCIYAEARDAGCGVIGKGMTSPFVLPTTLAEVVVDVTAVTAGPGVCPGMCVAGHCPTPDAGMDAGVRDATSDLPSSDVPIVPMDMPGVDVPGIDASVDMSVADVPGVDMTMPDMGPPPCTGCLTGSTCNAGIGNATCGSGGGTCSVCTSSQECVAQTCVTRTARFVEAPGTSWLLRANGSLYSAGDDGHMQRGMRTSVSPAFSLEPLSVTPAGDVVAVGATQFATCAIASTGQLYCWGNNGYGLLARSTFDATMSTDTPTLIAGALAAASWVAIDGGTQHFCAIQVNGSLWCWGDGAAGQLGTGGGAADYPTHVGSSTWLQVSAGDVHTCAVRSDHALYCWGDDTHGQLGIGSTTAMTTPAAVASPTGMGWQSVSAEGTHTCAIDVGGHLYCWGDHGFGRLGISGLTADVLSPQLVGGATDVWLSVSAGQYHTCGVRRAATDTDGLCWGANTFGEIGDGGATGEQDAPFMVDNGWAHVAAGWQTSCATFIDGTQPQCWGSNDHGKLGIGLDPATLSVNTPMDVSPPAL